MEDIYVNSIKNLNKYTKYPHSKQIKVEENKSKKQTNLPFNFFTVLNNFLIQNYTIEK